MVKCETYRNLLRDRDEKIRIMETAISEIHPWLSASLIDNSCQEYADACCALMACVHDIADDVPIPSPALIWSHYTPRRMAATIDDRVWHAGPRVVDGCWEFHPPDHHVQGSTENWTKGECLAKAQEFLERG